MTNKEKIKYLSQYKTIRRKIQRLTEEIQDWKAIADIASPGYSDMPKGGGERSNSIETAIENILEIEKELKQRIRELIRTRRRIDRVIRAVEDSTLREVLERRYIDGTKWEEISETMGYEKRWIMRLHKKALECVNTPC